MKLSTRAESKNFTRNILDFKPKKPNFSQFIIIPNENNIQKNKTSGFENQLVTCDLAEPELFFFF